MRIFCIASTAAMRSGVGPLEVARGGEQIGDNDASAGQTCCESADQTQGCVAAIRMRHLDVQAPGAVGASGVAVPT